MAKKQLVNEAEILRDARRYVSRWFEDNKNADVNSLSKLHLDHDSDVRQYNYANRDNKKVLRCLSKLLLECAFDLVLREQPKLKRIALANSILCNKEDLSSLKTWVKATTGSVNDDDLYVMAHWMWLVKRNALELPIVYHIMPIITSAKQGGGKSTSIQRLIQPLEELSLELKMPQVVDERSFTMFSEHLIGFFDEMAGADKVEISDFKRNVTSSTLTYRPMRTNSTAKIKNLCSFIGASNNSVFENIKDTTGLRRFFQINALDALDHAAINGIDYLALWKGIDEKLDRGYYERVKDQVVKKQEDLQMKDEVALFLEDFNVLPTVDGTIVEVNGKSLYNDYRKHAMNSGLKVIHQAQVFYKKVREMGIHGTKRRDKTKSIAWFFLVNKDSAINLEDKTYDS